MKNRTLDQILMQSFMTDKVIIHKIQALPANLQAEVVDFIEFLTRKYLKDAENPKVPEYGSLKGTFKMADDFDAPLYFTFHN
ncbi:MAG: DUF2281 domain-containing protein [Bacteroidota bacterium]